MTAKYRLFQVCAFCLFFLCATAIANTSLFQDGFHSHPSFAKAHAAKPDKTGNGKGNGKGGNGNNDTSDNSGGNGEIFTIVNGVRVVENQLFTTTLEIDGSDWDGAVIRNNVFSGQADKGLHVSNVHNLTIEDNEFFGMQSNAVKLRSYQDRGTQWVVIRNNYFHDMPDTAILSGEPNLHTVIQNNTFENVATSLEGNKKHAMYLKGPEFIVEGNSIYGVGSANGISVRTAGLVRGNWVQGARKDGIKYYSSSDTKGSGLLVIENNVIVDCGHGGIAFASGSGKPIDNAIVRFNTAANNYRGMWIYDGLETTGIEVCGNVFIQPNTKFLWVEMDHVVFQENIFAEGDIGFVDYAQYDFNLTSHSLARDHVASLTDSPPPYDCNGCALAESPYDAGAMQYLER